MVLPIYGYGFPVLKKVATDIEQSHENLQELIDNMWETMYNAHGVGLAAPQIGKSIRLFIVDTIQVLEDEDEDEEEDEEQQQPAIEGIKKVFINAHLVDELGEPWEYEEGCLSIPKIRGDVQRPETIRIKYLDEQFNEHMEEFDSINARVIQHEYDHLEGVLFTEKLKPIKKRRVKRKLEEIKKGQIEVDYKMKFFEKKR